MGREKEFILAAPPPPLTPLPISVSIAPSPSVDSYLNPNSQDSSCVCGVCNAEFQTADILSQHVSLKHIEKPYKCELCKKCFKQGGDLRIFSGNRTMNRFNMKADIMT